MQDSDYLLENCLPTISSIYKFIYFIIFLAVICLIMTSLRDYGENFPRVFIMFSIREEASIFTWIHTIMLFVGFILAQMNYNLARITHPSQKMILYGWLFLSLLFLFISADEAGMIHERIGYMYHELTASKKLNLPSGWFLTAYAPFIVASVIFLTYFFIKLYKADRRGGLIAFTGLGMWVNSIVFEKIDGIYRQSTYFIEGVRPIIRYTTELSELGGTIVFTLFMLHNLKNIPKAPVD